MKENGEKNTVITNGESVSPTYEATAVVSNKSCAAAEGSTEAEVVAGIEETSISATAVIEKFENKTVNGTAEIKQEKRNGTNKKVPTSNGGSAKAAPVRAARPAAAAPSPVPQQNGGTVRTGSGTARLTTTQSDTAGWVGGICVLGHLLELNIYKNYSHGTAGSRGPPWW